jgi:hypothetical protein
MISAIKQRDSMDDLCPDPDDTNFREAPKGSRVDDTTPSRHEMMR